MLINDKGWISYVATVYFKVLYINYLRQPRKVLLALTAMNSFDNRLAKNIKPLGTKYIIIIHHLQHYLGHNSKSGNTQHPPLHASHLPTASNVRLQRVKLFFVFFLSAS